MWSGMLSLFWCNIVICKRSFAYPFCPILCSHPCTFPQHFLWPFFSLLDNFLSFVVQLLLHLSLSNSLFISCFQISSLSKSFPKRETFLFQPLQKFPVLENFFRMQRYEIIITYKQKTNFFLKNTQKKWFFHFPTLLIAHHTSFSSSHTFPPLSSHVPPALPPSPSSTSSLLLPNTFVTSATQFVPLLLFVLTEINYDRIKV